jgi:hypothetical protein
MPKIAASMLGEPRRRKRRVVTPLSSNAVNRDGGHPPQADGARERPGAEPRPYYLYVLIDPRSGEPFYVGKGCGNRMYQHRGLCKQMLSDCVPIYEKWFESEDEDFIYFLEIFVIHFFGRALLTNRNDGGRWKQRRFRFAARRRLARSIGKTWDQLTDSEKEFLRAKHFGQSTEASPYEEIVQQL